MNNHRNRGRLTIGDTPLQLHLTFGVEILTAILRRYGVAGWNAWIRRLHDMRDDPLNPPWSEADPSPAMQMFLNFEGADLSNQDLDSIDLGDPWLSGADFSCSSLRRARICSVPRALFWNADLRGADMSFGEITGADFTGAKIDGANFRGIMFDADSPPKGLPPDLVGRLHRESAEIWSRWSVTCLGRPLSTVVPSNAEIVENP